MLYVVYLGEDDPLYPNDWEETHDINRAYEIYNSEEHAVIIGHRWIAGEFIEQTIAEK